MTNEKMLLAVVRWLCNTVWWSCEKMLLKCVELQVRPDRQTDTGAT